MIWAWLLCGLPFAGALLWNPILLIPMVAFLDTGHLLSPIALAWSHRGFRSVMQQQQWKYILIPITIILATTVLGATVDKTFQVNPLTMGVRVSDWSDYARPFVLMLPIYVAWNIYHFGMQNFGFVSIFKGAGRTRRRRQVHKWACLATVVIGMVLIPRTLRIPVVALLLGGGFAANHWLSAIGLSSYIWGRHTGRSPLWFGIGLVVVGGAVFWLIYAAPGFALQITMTAIGLRVGLGFVHFLYDRWLYKFSDPQVRATIGVSMGMA